MSEKFDWFYQRSLEQEGTPHEVFLSAQRSHILNKYRTPKIDIEFTTRRGSFSMTLSLDEASEFGNALLKLSSENGKEKTE